MASTTDNPAWHVRTLGGHNGGVGELHVTFICTGNICRSPMAEKIFGTHLERAGLADRVRVSSAGMSSWHAGSAADPRAVATLQRAGYPTEHVAAAVGPEHLAADLLVALDSGHDRYLAESGVPSARRRLLRSFDPDADGLEVGDPYTGGIAGFDRVLGEIEAAMPGLLVWVREQLGEPSARR